MKRCAAILALLAVGSRADEQVKEWECAVKRCTLKSSLAAAGPAFQDILAMNAKQPPLPEAGAAKSEGCPFADDDEKGATKKEWTKYMKGLSEVGNMGNTPEDRRQWAIQYAAHLKQKLREEEANPPKKPSVDVTQKGVEAVNKTSLSELMNLHQSDLLVTFYAPWCPHCKTFVMGEGEKDAPIEALNQDLALEGGPNVVKFDVTASEAPFKVTAVPTIYLIRKNGEHSVYGEDPADFTSLIRFALDMKLTPKATKEEKEAQLIETKPHLRKARA